MLDVERFRKVEALARAGATDGERAAAASRLDVMARAAGMTLDEAKARAGTITEEEKLAAHFRREHDRMLAEPRRRERREKLAERFGSEDSAEKAILIDTDQETALRRAVDHHLVRAKTTGWEMGSLSGWNGGRDMPDIVRASVEGAFPMPTTVTGIWAEHQGWEELLNNRDAFDPWYDPPVWNRARMRVLETALDTMPAAALDDVEARLSWMRFTWEMSFMRDVHDELRWLETLRADVTRLARGGADRAHPSSVQSGHGTARDRRAHVLSILDTPESASLSDREIARLAGVSPTTVGKMRRR